MYQHKPCKTTSYFSISSSLPNSCNSLPVTHNNSYHILLHCFSLSFPWSSHSLNTNFVRCILGTYPNKILWICSSELILFYLTLLFFYVSIFVPLCIVVLYQYSTCFFSDSLPLFLVIISLVTLFHEPPPS